MLNLKKFFAKITSDELTVYSAQASYYITVSAFPFLIMLISLTGFFIPREMVFNAIADIIPEIIKPVMLKLVDELSGKSVSLISFGAVTAMWSASRGVAAVERGICRVYENVEKRNFISSALYSILYTLLFMGVLVLTLLFQVFGDFIINFFNIDGQGILLRGLIFFCVTVVIFCLMYYIFSGRQPGFSKHLPGAIVSATGWILFSRLYSVYIENFSNYSYIYGSLTAVVLMLLWIYVCVIILLFGAEINKLIMKRSEYFG